jgi:hypothetical protein
VRRHGDAAALAEGALINRGARNYRSYADLAVAYEERVWDSNGRTTA